MYLLPTSHNNVSVGTITVDDGISINDANRIKSVLSQMVFENQILQDMLYGLEIL